MTKAEDATTESTTSKEYKDGKSSDNVPWIDEEKCAEGIVPMVHKDQRKGENVDEEYENLSEVVNMKHNCIDGSCAQTGNLRRWLDRRAGSPGVITSYLLF